MFFGAQKNPVSLRNNKKFNFLVHSLTKVLIKEIITTLRSKIVLIWTNHLKTALIHPDCCVQ